MLQLFVNANYDFVGKRRWYYIASAVLLVVSVLAIAINGGLNYGIDFTGGTLIQVRYDKPASVAEVRRGLDEIEMGGAIIQQFGDPQEYLIRLPQLDQSPEQVTSQVQAALAQSSGGNVEIRRVEFVGPQVGRDLQIQALYAVLAGMAGILIYIAIRFDYRGGVVSIAAIAHDVIITLGALTIFHFEMSLSVLAALLTIVGYSINDTIVIFDRIRETRARGLRKGQTIVGLVNGALNQTLSRTVLTSFTTFLAAFVLFLFGGEVLRDFAFALVVGIVLGTYSTLAAASLMADWETWSRSRQTAPRKVPAKA